MQNRKAAVASAAAWLRILGFQAQTLEIFDYPLPSSAWTEHGALPPRTFPKKGLLGNIAEP
jgi:hypothetical protein